MRIGITGATGLVGQAFARLATGAGHEIIAYSRSGKPATHARETLSSDKGSLPCPEQPLDALVHLAGESLMGLWTPAKKKRMWESRVNLTEAMMDSISKWPQSHRPPVILSASGIGYYGSQGDTQLDESAAKGTGFLADLCEKWEAAARKAESWNARVIHLRTSMVLAREGGAYPLLKRLFGLGLGGPLGDGRQWMSWIHIHDQTGLMLWALENPQVGGPLNLCSPAPELNRNFTRKLARSLHRPAILPAPAWGLKLALRGMADEMLLCSQRGVPAKARDQGYIFAFSALEDALADLK